MKEGKINLNSEKDKEGIHMNYKRRALELLGEIEDNDIIFLRQICTIINKHINKRKS